MRRLLAVFAVLALAACGGSEDEEICLDEAGVCVPEGTRWFCTGPAPEGPGPLCPKGQHRVESWEIMEHGGETYYRPLLSCVDSLSECI